MNEIKLNCVTDEQILKIRISLDQYLYLQKHLNSFDENFKRIYYNFYLKAQPIMRSKENRDIYFHIMEECKNCIEIEDIITKLYDKLGLIEFSFATKMLHTYHNEFPIYDSKVKEYLNSIKNGVKKNILSKGIYNSTEMNKYQYKVNNIKTYWHNLIDWYNNFLNSKDGKNWIKWFNIEFPDAKDISDIKKVDFIIYGCN